MSKKKINEYLDTVIIGSGLSALNFIETYSVKKKKVNVISPNFSNKIFGKEIKKIKHLPSQMRDKRIQAENFFTCNNITKSNSCKVLGSLDFGGLSNYWGLQIDNYINLKSQNLKKKVIKEIYSSFIGLINKYSLIGKFKSKNKIYNNEFRLPKHLLNLIKENDKNSNFKILQPLLAYKKNLKEKELNLLNEEKDKINSKNFLKFSKLNKKIIFHNFYVKEMHKEGKKIKLICRNQNKEKIFFVNKVIMATGTIATTKIIMNFLNFKKEIKISHHPRLISVFLGRKSIQTNLNFTPSLLQLIGVRKKNFFSADLRPGNNLITESMLELSSFLYPFKFFINLLKKRLIFSNILLPPKFSNIFIKKEGSSFLLYTKKNIMMNKLRKANIEVFNFLLKKKIIFPFFKTHFPGIGSDFHYFGTLPINGKSKLSVNENCQLKNHKNIYIIDSSVFNFKNNKYPLGIVMANARRIGKLLS